MPLPRSAEVERRDRQHEDGWRGVAGTCGDLYRRDRGASGDTSCRSPRRRHDRRLWHAQPAPYVRSKNGLRPRLHLLHHPLWPWQFTARSLRACRGSDQRAVSTRAFNEVVLTAVDLTSWGADFPRRPGWGIWSCASCGWCPDCRACGIQFDRFIEGTEETDAGHRHRTRLIATPALELASTVTIMILKRMQPRPTCATMPSLCPRRPAACAPHDLCAGHHRRLSDRNRRYVRKFAQAGDVNAILTGCTSSLLAREGHPPPHGCRR